MCIPVAPAGLEVGGTAVGDPVPAVGFGGCGGWCRRRGLSCRLRGRGCRTISWWSCKSNHTSFNYFDRLLFAIVHILRTFLPFFYYLEFAKY